MQVKEIMQKTEMLNSLLTLAEARERIQNADLDMMPVCYFGLLVGYIAREDIEQAIADGRDPQLTMIEDIVRSEIPRCLETDSIEIAEQKMEENSSFYLLVLRDDEVTIAGIIKQSDLPVHHSNQ